MDPIEHLSLQDKLLVALIFYSPVIIAFVFGTIIGSLSNVIIHRIVYYKSIWSPPSHCTSCGKEIPWYLNIPLLSYMILRGRCRFCGAKFSSRYFWVELMSGLLYAIVMLWVFTFPEPHGLGMSFGKLIAFDLSGTSRWTFTPNILTMVLMFKGFVFASFLLILTMIDLEHKLLPDRITIPGIYLGLLLGFMAPSALLGEPVMFRLGDGWWAGPIDAFLKAFIGFLIGGGILFLIAWIFPAGMGGGDIKLMAMVGAFVGAGAIGATLFMGFVLGGFIGILLMLMRKATRKTMIPFGPFLATGGFLGFLWGKQIWGWYIMKFISEPGS